MISTRFVTEVRNSGIKAGDSEMSKLRIPTSEETETLYYTKREELSHTSVTFVFKLYSIKLVTRLVC